MLDTGSLLSLWVHCGTSVASASLHLCEPWIRAATLRLRGNPLAHRVVPTPGPGRIGSVTPKSGSRAWVVTPGPSERRPRLVRQASSALRGPEFEAFGPCAATVKRAQLREGGARASPGGRSLTRMADAQRGADRQRALGRLKKAQLRDGARGRVPGVGP